MSSQLIQRMFGRLAGAVFDGAAPRSRCGPASNAALIQRAAHMKKDPTSSPLSLPGYFKKHGYTTVYVGKVSHHPGGRGGQDWDDDVRVVLFVVLRNGLKLDDELSARIRKVVRDNATPRHVPAVIIQVSDIPRTVSGKIVELAVRNVIHGRAVKNVDALANPEALDLYKDLPELSL